MAFIDYEEMAKRNAEALKEASGSDEVFNVTAIDTKNHVVQLNGRDNVEIYTLLKAIEKKDCAVKNFDVLKKEIDTIAAKGNEYIIDNAVKNLLRMSNYIINNFNIEQTIKEFRTKGIDTCGADTNIVMYFESDVTSINKNECPGFKGYLNNTELKNNLDKVEEIGLICLTAFDGILWLSYDVKSNHYTIQFEDWDTANDNLVEFVEKTGLGLFKKHYVGTYAIVCNYIKHRYDDYKLKRK